MVLGRPAMAPFHYQPDEAAVGVWHQKAVEPEVGLEAVAPGVGGMITDKATGTSDAAVYRNRALSGSSMLLARF